MLAKNPGDRYQSCAEFVTALQEAVGAGEVRYPASAPTLAATTSPKRRAVDPDAPTQLRKGATRAAPPQRKSRALPILASAAGVLAVAAAVLCVYVSGAGSGERGAGTDRPRKPRPRWPRHHRPCRTSLITRPVPPQTKNVTTTVAAAPAPYVGMPCRFAERGQESPDGTLYCTGMGPQPHYVEKKLSGPSARAGTPCTELGARAPAAQTEGNVTCMARPGGSLIWGFS